mmetsp:Transcript_35192/g.80394  ORF Transcript_35192/g.80394 Transcript_35192/m.80394 type:complete len:376 (+) Transcript_35192:147-1274(+)
MGKKSKAKQKQTTSDKKGQSKQRCISCKVFVKSVDKGNVCPGCDGLYCGPCSTYQSKKCVGFHFCQNTECNEPGLCHNCAFMGGFRGAGKDRKYTQPMSTCIGCYEMICGKCSSWETKGYNGHTHCMECFQAKCHKCAFESGKPEDTMVFCSACLEFKCMKCEPQSVFTLDKGEQYCGTCVENPEVATGSFTIPILASSPEQRKKLTEMKKAKEEEQEKDEQRRKNGPKFYKSAIGLYFDKNRTKVEKANPDAGASAVSEILMKKWKALPSNERRFWDDKAVYDRKRYERGIKTYHEKTKEAGVDEPETLDCCANCGKKAGDGNKLKNCTACYLVKYCSVDCQKAHRKIHKTVCLEKAAESNRKKKTAGANHNCP